MDYGDAQYRVANWVQLRNGADVRRLVRKLPKSNKPARRTGLALQAALNTFSTAPAGNLNILVLITKGKSSDDVVIPAANLRKKGEILRCPNETKAPSFSRLDSLEEPSFRPSS